MKSDQNQPSEAAQLGRKSARLPEKAVRHYGMAIDLHVSTSTSAKAGKVLGTWGMALLFGGQPCNRPATRGRFELSAVAPLDARGFGSTCDRRPAAIARRRGGSLPPATGTGIEPHRHQHFPMREHMSDTPALAPTSTVSSATSSSCPSTTKPRRRSTSRCTNWREPMPQRRSSSGMASTLRCVAWSGEPR